jgi:hypothetical protein
MADVLLSGWSDGRVLAHSSETGAPLWFIDNAHVGGVTALVMSHNKRFILTGKPQGSFHYRAEFFLSTRWATRGGAALGAEEQRSRIPSKGTRRESFVFSNL